MKDTVFTLANGVEVPGLGYGTFAPKDSSAESYKSTLKALELGYRHLDCAWYYGNEGAIGDAIADFLKARPDLSRKDLFVSTKVWNHLHGEEGVKWSLNDSLKNLKLDYVDMFLLHWPIAAEKDDSDPPQPKLGPDGKYIINHELTNNHESTWRGMEQIYREKRARAIGVSNFKEEQLAAMAKYATVLPMVNQIEVHPFLPNDKLVEYCRKANILVEAYSPLGSQNQVPTTGEKVNENPVLNRIAQEGNHTLAQVLIAWGLRRGYVVLPKSANPERMKSNLEQIELSDAQFNAVNEVAKGRHARFVNMKDTFGYDLWPNEKCA